jgi:hypothetical protein
LLGGRRADKRLANYYNDDNCTICSSTMMVLIQISDPGGIGKQVRLY